MPFCHASLAATRPADPAYPLELRTIGDHVRAHRLERGLLQRQAAEEIGAVVESIRNWELGWRPPAIRHLPGIIRFLGYSPLLQPSTLAEKIRMCRQLRGRSREKLAHEIGRRCSHTVALRSREKPAEPEASAQA